MKNQKRKIIIKLFYILFFLVACFLVMATYADETKIDEFVLNKLAGRTFVSDVYVMYADKTIKRISPGNGGIYYQSHINPEGGQVVFFGNRQGPPQIWLADLKKSTLVPLTKLEDGARHPVFSRDGKKIAYSSSKGFNQPSESIELMNGNGTPPRGMNLNIFVMDLESRKERQITFGPYQDQRPCFSPDGETIAFISNRGAEMSLWKTKITGESEPQLIYSKQWCYRPWYSSDGQWIYFFKRVNGRHRICRISSNGGDVFPMTNDDKGSSHGPFYDEWKNVLLIHSNRGGQWGIWELPLDNSPPVKIDTPAFAEALHATRSANGTIAFDVQKIKPIRRIASRVKKKVKYLLGSK
jgi:Tol biopolymer transport system component